MNERLKITPSHLSRQAIVYLRQSSAAQVENNRESTDRQYALGADPGNTEWQRDLSVLFAKVGNVLAQQGEFDEALKVYRQDLAVSERLTAADPSNMQWQRDLSISYEKIGNVLAAQGKFDEALKAYRDRLAIAERLATADPSNTEWQGDLSTAYERVGDALVAKGKLDEALKAFRDSLVIAERLAATDPSNTRSQSELQFCIDRFGAIAYNFILAHNFATALEAVDQAISLAPDKIWLYTNRAHALMFLDRIDEARALYLKYRRHQNVEGDKSWETVILADFAELQKAGLTHPLMQEIEKVFAGT